MQIRRTKIKHVKKIGKTNKPVYDISMVNQDHRWFFANGLLVHNTDSSYFSAYPALKDEIEAGKIKWEKEDVTEVYDTIANNVSDTFPQFLADTFGVPLENSTGVIKAGREIIAETGLYITKKRYAALVFDDEGTRKDINGSPGKIKVTGLDLRRSDTPKFVQEFLMDILVDTLTGKGEKHVVEKVKDFKEKFDKMKPWEKGSPKAANNLTKYREAEIASFKAKGKRKKVTMPGHVRASINWNALRDMHNDNITSPIIDGQKVIVCKLKETVDNRFTSIAYPVDETHLPEWFTTLPFDEETMLHTIVDKKVSNLLNVLKWDFSMTDKQSVFMETLFDFSGIDNSK